VIGVLVGVVVLNFSVSVSPEIAKFQPDILSHVSRKQRALQVMDDVAFFFIHRECSEIGS
jgi:hypothetical protein